MRHRFVHCHRELVIGRAAIIVTVLASLLAVGGIARSVLQAAGLHRWGASLGQSLFLALVSFLIYGGLVYQLARLGHLHRVMRHRSAGAPELQRFFHRQQAPSVTILVPSYREDPQVVRRTLLSAALQDYPRRRVVLLIDDPPTPSRPQDIELLAAARSLPDEIEEMLRKPAEHFADAQSRLSKRLARGPLDATGEILALAQLHREAASWFEEQT